MNGADQADGTNPDSAGARPLDRAGTAAAAAAREAVAQEFREEAERLLAAVRRSLSTPKSRMALVLRLSLLPPPLPRPHHRRIARAILEEAAQQNQGEMFELPCGDMVLLCRVPSVGTGTDAALHPTALPPAFARLLRVDAPGGALATLWNLERDGAALLGYASGLVG